jgi:hypothetical protein
VFQKLEHNETHELDLLNKTQRAPKGALPSPSSKKKTKTERTTKSSALRKPDPIWDSIVSVFGFDSTKLTKGDRSRIGKVVRDLKIKQATPDEIRARYERMATAWRTRRFGPEALVKHWDQYKLEMMDDDPFPFG